MNYEPQRASLNERTALRHSAVVRITHWLIVLGVGGLIYSGVGILISHPRLYWGETGAVGAPSLIDLPIPFIIGPSVWQRPIHFLFAWILLFAGLAYVVAGLVTQHFRKETAAREAGAEVAAHHRPRSPIICAGREPQRTKPGLTMSSSGSPISR